jgi:hypothetical protein
MLMTRYSHKFLFSKNNSCATVSPNSLSAGFLRIRTAIADDQARFRLRSDAETYSIRSKVIGDTLEAKWALSENGNRRADATHTD